MVRVLCTDINVTAVQIFLTIFCSLMYTFNIIVMIWCTYLTIKNRIANSNKCFFYLTVTYFFFNIVVNIMWMNRTIFYCIDVEMTQKFAGFGGPPFMLQFVLLVYILFYRVVLVFSGTAFQLKRSTSCCLHVYVVIFIVIWGAHGWTQSSALQFTIWGVLTETLSFLTGVTTLILLAGLFMHKLIKIEIASNESNEESKLMSTVTKTFILTSICVTSYSINALVYTTNLMVTDANLFFIGHIFGALDKLTSFMTVFLGYNQFFSYYIKICKCHPKCVAFFRKRANAKHDVQLTREIESQMDSQSPSAEASV
eukprot:947125_1